MQQERFKHLQGLVEGQQMARQQWQENGDAEGVAQMIQEEAEELVEAIALYDVLDRGPYEVVSEIGDILYLTLRLCSEMGIDPGDALELKLLRNSVKYPDTFSSNGWDYEEARRLSKSLYGHMGGDKAFFDWHSEHAPIEEPKETVIYQSSESPYDDEWYEQFYDPFS
jgi:NTP pyrophosphatase (non-canonical NTP hydrolase)